MVRSTFPLKTGEVITVKVGASRLEYTLGLAEKDRGYGGQDEWSALARVTEITPSGTNKLPPSDHEIVKMPGTASFSFDEKYSTAAG